jgi:hypothetical protein
VTYRDWRVIGKAGDVGPVEITVNDTGQIIFGRCRCPFFDEHLLNQGPCEHMLALFQVSEPLRVDGASSQAAEQPRGKTTRREPSRWEVDSAAQSGDVTDDLSGSEEDA